ncbi:hypothetical protein BH09ACT10_BH09ACT10_19660 [soil metagenome]
MNPRHRRLILPGLLAILLVVVVVASLTKRADASVPPTADVVSTMTDPRIDESSGLAVSTLHPDLAYTINDSDNEPLIYAIQISTGKTVGTTRLTGYELSDTEAMSIDGKGRIWVADTGDNNGERGDSALYVLREPGRGSHSVRPTRYAVAYDNGPQDVEALAINPKTGAVYLFSKGLLRGEMYEFPANPSKTEVNVLPHGPQEFPLLVTDASFKPDGTSVVVRTYVAAYAYDAENFTEIATALLPVQGQGETLAYESSGRSYLIGSEGEDSQLIRIKTKSTATASAPTATPDATKVTTVDASDSSGGIGNAWIIGAALVALVTAVLLVMTLRTRPGSD